MFEYRPDHLAVIYRTDDPHSALALWTDQGINFPGLRRDRLQCASTQMPAGIHGRSLCISHGQNRAADRPRIRYGAGCIQITVNNLLDIRPPESILPREMFIIDLDKGFKIVLYTAVVIRRLWIPGAINSGRKGHDLSPLRISCRHNVERSFYLSRGIFRQSNFKYIRLSIY